MGEVGAGAVERTTQTTRPSAGRAERTWRRDGKASPRGVLFSALLLAGSVFFLAWSWIAAPSADAYRAGTVCAADDPVNARCRTLGVDTIERVSPPSDTPHTVKFRLVLQGSARVPGGTMNVTVVSLGHPPAVGGLVSVVGWQGHLLTATGNGFSGSIGETPYRELGAVLFYAALLLVAGLGVVHLSLGPRGYGPRGRLRHAQRNGLILFALGFVALLAGDVTYGVGVATFGTVLVLVWCAAAGRAVFVQAIKEAEEHGPLPQTWSEVRAARQAAGPRSDGCPVTKPQQAWIESSLLWLATQFGYDPVQRPTVLPTQAFFPLPYTGTDEDIRALVRTVCPLMGIAADRITVRLIGEPSPKAEARRYVVHHEHYAAGVFERGADGELVIELDRATAGDQATMTAVIAHELGHARLIGENRIEADRADHEPLTDLATVFFGLGIFNANAARIPTPTAAGYAVTRLGYLDQRMFGYALACYARMRNAKNPQWATYLSPLPLEYMNRSTAYLQKAAPYGGFPTEQH